MKKISIRDNKRLYDGFFTVVEAAAVSLGNEGKLAVLEGELVGLPILTKDGVSIAKNIYFRDKHKAMGAHMAKQCAAATVVKTADSTTSTLVLAKAIIESCKKEEDYYFNKKVERGMNIAFEEISNKMSAYSKKVNKTALRQIASVSANNSKEIGDLIIEAHSAVGKNGIIEVIEHDSPITQLKISKGIQLQKGWVNPFLTNNQKTAEFEADDVFVVVYEGYLDTDEAIQSFAEENRQSPILIIAENFSEDFLFRLTELHRKGTLNVCAVKCPEFDNKRRALLSDIAMYTGGEVFLQGTSKKIVAGKVKRVVVGQDTTSIIQDTVSDAVLERIEELKEQLLVTSEKAFIQKRISNLEGVSATILVGGATASEAKEKFDRVEDAVGATKSALKEGWIAGGGSTFVKISHEMNSKFDNEDVQFGYDGMKQAIQSVFRQICSNSNRNAENYLSLIDEYGKGYNASVDEVTDLIKDGIIDSTYSLKVALTHAKSTAILMLNVGCVVVL